MIDKARSSRPSTTVTDVSIAKAAELLENVRRLTLRELSASLNISFERIQHIMTEILQMCRVCARWVPGNLTEEQMQRRVQVCMNTVEMSEMIRNFVTSIVRVTNRGIIIMTRYQNSSKVCGNTRIHHHSKNSVHLSQPVKSCFCCSLMRTV